MQPEFQVAWIPSGVQASKRNRLALVRQRQLAIQLRGARGEEGGSFADVKSLQGTRDVRSRTSLYVYNFFFVIQELLQAVTCGS